MLFNTAAVSTVAVALLAGSANAVNMRYYKGAPGVTPLFGNFLEQFYTQAEATTAASTTAFQSFFADDAQVQIAGQTEWTGEDGVAVFKVAVAEGNKFNHYPRVPSVVSTTYTTQTLAIQGSAKETYPNGTCVSTDYVSQWTFTTNDGQPVTGQGMKGIKILNLVSKAPSAGGCTSY